MNKFLYSLLAIPFFFSCSETGNDHTDLPKACTVSGVAQKGQLAKGSQVTAFAIDNSLVATGESFPANISDDRGSFAISGKTSAPYLELRVDGYYFNELTGKMSESPLYLEALVRSSDKQANLNLMTTAVKLRVKHLIEHGKSFEEAQSQAQTEFLKALGITADTGNFEDMDITKGSESDAVLLSVACMIQYGRTAGEITTLIQELASDLGDDGIVSGSSAMEITASKESIDVIDVVENLDRYYKEKGMSEAKIPRFYGFLDESLNKDFVLYERPATPIYLPLPPGTPDGASYFSFDGELFILSQIEFEVTSDCDWITVSKEHVAGPEYKVSYSGATNTGKTARTGHIVFKDMNGKVLHTIERTQGEYIEPRYKLMLDFSANTKVSIVTEDKPKVGDYVLVNKDLVQVKEISDGYPVVEVKPALMYRVSWPAENMGYNENPAYVVKTFPAEVGSGADVQYYGCLKLQDLNYSNYPYRISMKLTSAIMNFSTVYYPQASYAVITGNGADDCLSGTVAYVWVLSELYLDPSLKEEYYSFENKSRSVRVNNLDNENTNSVEILPQTLDKGLTIQLFDKTGKELVSKSTSTSITFSRGLIVSLGKL